MCSGEITADQPSPFHENRSLITTFVPEGVRGRISPGHMNAGASQHRADAPPDAGKTYRSSLASDPSPFHDARGSARTRMPPRPPPHWSVIRVTFESSGEVRDSIADWAWVLRARSQM